MTEPRLKSRLRVQALLRQAGSAGRFGAVLRRGDADAGSVLVLLRARAGLAIYSETYGIAGRADWLRGTGPDLVDQTAADAYVARRVAADPDLWVVEIETETPEIPFWAT